MTGEAAAARGSVTRSGSPPPRALEKFSPPTTADALRVTDPRSAGKASAPVRTKSASISESGLNAAPRREETGGEIGVLPKRSS